MSVPVPAGLRRLVEQRAAGRCEYCLIHAADTLLAHELDHIIAKKHRGTTVAENLAWACFLCNRFKGSDIASVDPESGRVMRLFNPRTDIWTDHFRLEHGQIIPLTAEGRVTELLLQFNRSDMIETRRLLIQSGRHGT